MQNITYATGLFFTFLFTYHWVIIKITIGEIKLSTKLEYFHLPQIIKMTFYKKYILTPSTLAYGNKHAVNLKFTNKYLKNNRNKYNILKKYICKFLYMEYNL